MSRLTHITNSWMTTALWEVAVPDFSPVVRRQRLGERLRVIREQLGLTGEKVGAAVERSASWVSRLENGDIGIRAKELKDLLDHYRVADPVVRQELLTLAEQGRRPAWWSRYRGSLPSSYYRYIGYEAEATRIQWTGLIIPGLLQTERYAESAFAAIPGVVPPRVSDDRIAVRMERQKLIFDDHSVSLEVILAESALRSEVGGRSVLCEQLDALVRATQRPNIDVRIVPTSSPVSPNVPSSLAIMTVAERDELIVYREDPAGSTFETGEAAEHLVALYGLLVRASFDRQDSLRYLDQIHAEICPKG